MKKERKDESFLKKPWYKGGGKALSDFIYKELKYPKSALQNQVEGVVSLRLGIDFQGVVVDAKVLTSIGDGCDEEAIRIAKLLKFEVAKTPRKLKVLFHRNLNIQFKLPKNKFPSENTNIASPQYTYVTREQKVPEKKEYKSYTYTLRY